MALSSLPLKDGNRIPLISFGTGTAWYKKDPSEPFNRDLVENCVADDLLWQDVWLAMEQVKDSGKAKSIGVSNHQRPHLEEILKVATIIPAINQLEFHPYLQRAHNYLPWMREKGIEVASFNGLTPITKARPGPLDDLFAAVAKKHGVTENAFLIKWQIDQNVVVTTTTTKVGRLSEYLRAIDLKLSVEEQEEITQIGLSHHFRACAPDRFEPDDRS